MYAIADYDLDVDGPFPKPSKETICQKPGPIPYQDNLIRFRFYGRNVQKMVVAASEMEPGETRSAFINLIASFMLNSCRNWNNEVLSEELIAEHMKILSSGKLVLSPEEITILYHNKDSGRPITNDRPFRSNNNRNKNFRKGGHLNKNKNLNRNRRG